MKTIIVADDDSMFRAIITRQLSQPGFSVVEKVSGKAVVREIEEIHPVACLIDMVMDEKEGIETIMEIAKLPERPKIVAVSSNQLYLEMAVDLGADPSLKKTVSQQHLQAILSELQIQAH